MVSNTHVGEVWESDATLVVVRLANTTDKPLHLSRIGGTCDCVKVTPASAVLAPRGELAVSLTYDFTDRVPSEFGKLAREFEVALSVEVGGVPLKPLVLSGVCRSRLASSTTVLHFGESNGRGRPPVARRLTITADADTASIHAVADDDTVQIGTPERRGNEWHVQITPAMNQTRERFDTMVRFTALDRAGAVIGTCRVAVDGTVGEPADHLWEGAHAP